MHFLNLYTFLTNRPDLEAKRSQLVYEVRILSRRPEQTCTYSVSILSWVYMYYSLPSARV